MMYYGPYSDNLSTFTLLKQIAQIPQNLLLAARVNNIIILLFLIEIPNSKHFCNSLKET